MIRSLAASVVLIASFGPMPVRATEPDISEIDIPAPTRPNLWADNLVAGPDGNMWFGGHNVGRITSTGELTFFPIHSLDLGIYSIEDVAAGKGLLWFLGNRGGGTALVSVTTDGSLDEVATLDDAFSIAVGHRIWVQTYSGLAWVSTRGVVHDVPLRDAIELTQIVAGDFRGVWATGFDLGQPAILHVRADGVVDTLDLPDGTMDTSYITVGPDGRIWFEARAGRPDALEQFPDVIVGFVAPTGGLRLFHHPTGHLTITGLAATPDGNVWYTAHHPVEGTTDQSVGRVGFVTPRGRFTEFPNHPDGYHIASGPTGSLWAAADRPVPSILEIATDGTITRHRLPYRRYPSTPVDISTGNDGSLWFTLNVSDQVGTMLPDGTFQLRNLPFGSHPIGVTQTDDDSVWVSMAYPGAIGRIAPDGTLSSFAVPTPYAYPYYLTEDAVGNVWFVEQHRRRGLGDWDWLSGSSIGRITPEGEITEIPVSEQNVALTDIASSPGGGIWYTGAGARYVGTRNLVGRIAPDGEISRFPLGVHQVPAGITPGPDGAMWFAINGNGAIGRITRQGTITTFPLPDGVHPWDIVSGADGALWFTVERRDAMIGRITVQGRVHLYDVPTSWSQPQGILRAGDGSLWFTEAGATRLGHLAPSG